jgi:hypothetical protein
MDITEVFILRSLFIQKNARRQEAARASPRDMQLRQLASDVDSDEEDALRRQIDPLWSRDAGAAAREDELDAEAESGEAMSPEELHAQRLGACPGHGSQGGSESALNRVGSWRAR